MNLSELCTTYINSAKLKDETDKTIIEFAEAPWGLGMGTVPGTPRLFPAQRFIFKCYYNIPLCHGEKDIIINDMFNEKELYRFDELEFLNYLYNEGRINVKDITGISEDTRTNLALVIGRRGLKTSSIAVLVAYETYKLLRKYSPQEYYQIMPDDEIRVSCIATNQEQASELFRRITGHLERSDYFKKYRNKPTLGHMLLSTQRDIDQYGEGQRPSIRIVAAPCSGRGIRGHNNIIVIIDEMAHFFESESSDDKSDRAVYDSVTPSVAKFNSPEGEPHGKVICISSPLNRAGKFYELYERSLDPDCKDLLMVHAASWEVDYTLSSKYLRAKYAENPISYMSEFGGKFSDRVTAWIDNEQILRVNVVPGLQYKPLSYERIPHFVGIDIGMKQDGTAIAIAHPVKKESEGTMRDFIELDLCEVCYADDYGKEYFQPEELADWLCGHLKKFFIVEGIMDQYMGMAFLPILNKKGFGQIRVEHFTRELNSKIYQNLMTKMLDASLRIPEGEKERIVEGKATKDSELVSELLRLQAVAHSKYLITVEAPQIKNYHDDLSDAFSRAVWLTTKYLSEGGGVFKSGIIESTSGPRSYKKYLAKQRKTAGYTKRPSRTIQMEMAQSRHFGSLMGSRTWR